MGRFRKKPVEIAAWRFTVDPKPGSVIWHPQWITDAIIRGDMWWQGGKRPYCTIKTLEGEMRATPGDWIIRGVAGEIYPCKPDIFEKTYEPVDANPYASTYDDNGVIAGGSRRNMLIDAVRAAEASQETP